MTPCLRCGSPAPKASDGRIPLCGGCAFSIPPRQGLGFGGVTLVPIKRRVAAAKGGT